MLNTRRSMIATSFAALTLRAAPGWAGAPAAWPGGAWGAADAAGWSPDALAAAHEFAASIGTASLFIAQNGRLIDIFGDPGVRFPLHSMRKSLLSALFGIAVQAGKIDLGATLAELGIDDVAPRLSPAERQATVQDLLEARSGVYHVALYETAGEQRERPARGSHAPGSFWYYNNWDFNVLGTIYERATGTSVFEAVARDIAGPLGMQDYRPADGHYVTGPQSEHRAYLFSMSARDLARFGLLYLRDGQWRDQAIVPAAWVKLTTASVSRTARPGIGYGYLWWVALPAPPNEMHLPVGGFWADGYRGQMILVDPSRDLVIVHQTNTAFVTDRQMGQLTAMILAAGT